ncbi:hypothetical protein [Oceaniovalibus guishaninsula]|nr:hypothetical protein [Oceaniovalibus guishaninsula]
MTRFIAITALLALAACAQTTGRPGGGAAATAIDRPAPPPEIAAVVTAPPPPAAARTAAALDTTTPEQKEAATAAATGGRLLGETVASLGDPTEPGLWIRTPLADAAGSGRLEYQGRSAVVQLIPADGPATGGSQVSLAAMRLLGAPLTDLPTLNVYAD